MAIATHQNIAKLYVATFNRAPDAAGLNYWVNSGMSIEDIAQSFFDQQETQTLYPVGTQTSAFITSVYQNLFNRVPDTDGLSYWAGQLDTHSVSNQNFILAVMNGALGLDATILTNKQTVGLDFVAKGLDSVDFAQSVMANIDASTDSVNTACSEIAKVAAPIGDLTEGMLSGLTFYGYPLDLMNRDSSNGFDILWKNTLNDNGTFLEEKYTAPFGSSNWTLEESDMNITWSFDNGRFVFYDSHGNNTWTDNLTLLSKTATEMKFYDQAVKTDTMGTSSTADDVTENYGYYLTAMLTPPPSARTEAQMLAAGLVKETFSGKLNFVNSSGASVGVPANEIVRLIADNNVDNLLQFTINSDGTFSGSKYTLGDVFNSNSTINYSVYQDNNHNDYCDNGELSGFVVTTTLAGISDTQTVHI
jgi:hypothetical protein